MKATLTVNLASDSHLLRTNLPIEIRDARLRLAGTLRGSGSLSLDPGTYRVSAVLGDGREHAEIVVIGEESGTSLTLGKCTVDDALPRQTIPIPASLEERWKRLDPKEGMAAEHDRRSGWRLGRMLRRILEKMFETSRPEPKAAVPLPPPLVLSKCVDAIVHGSTRDQWGFRATGRQIGVARFRASFSRWSVSLPVFVDRCDDEGYFLFNPSERRADAADCVVKSDRSQGRERPLALIAPWRAVASAMQHMLMERQLTHAANVVEAASDLLLYKYQDPVAAALGALVLHRIGRLGEHATWIDNLARDFPWLPDGRIVKAALLSTKAGDDARDEAVELLLSCVKARVLFTDSYSLLLELLRRHQTRPRHAARCGKALETLAAAWPLVEWGLPTFTVREERWL